MSAEPKFTPGERVIRYMNDKALFPCEPCMQLGKMHPACLPCDEKPLPTSVEFR